MHAVPRREPARDEQAKPVGVGQVEVGRAGELRVELDELIRRYAKAAVFDLDREAVRHSLGPHLDSRARRREQGRVLD